MMTVSGLAKETKVVAIESEVCDAWCQALAYVSPVLVDALAADQDRSGTWIEPVEGTVLLADVSGFTTISERLATLGREGAELLTSVINSFFERMLDIALTWGGVNLKFGGDALLLMFRGEQNARCAVAAALAMQAATREFRRVSVGPGQLRLTMSVGIHSGHFWSASAGLVDARLQHFLCGPDVAQVAAMQGTATAGEVLATAATCRQVAGLVTGEERGDGRKVLGLSRQALPKVSPLPMSLVRPERLGPLLPPYVATALASGADPRRPEGEHRKVSVVFISLLGVNELIENRGPDAFRDQIQAYVSEVVLLCERFGGYLVSNDVDAKGIKLILAFGAPTAHEDDSANAFRFALELKRGKGRLKLDFQHRIGINGGLVFAGEVGAPFRREYTVMGDAVNLAARLMAAAAPDQIVVSSATASEAGPRFVLRDLGSISVKGKSRPVPVLELEEELASEAKQSVIDQGPLLGRHTEVRRFTAACRQVENGNGRSIAISGEPGIGKSRLLSEFHNLARARGWLVLSVGCQFHTAGTPFAPWVSLLGDLFGFERADTQAERTEKVRLKIESLPPELIEVGAVLNGLLTVALEPSPMLAGLNEEDRRRRLFALVLDLLRQAGRGRPILLSVDDAHWADPSTLRLLEYVAAGLESIRVALLITYRPDNAGGSAFAAPVSLRLTLAELARDASAALARYGLGSRPADDVIVDAVLARAGGNPLFIEEVVWSLQDSDALERASRDTPWRSAESENPTVSDRVQSLMMARIDALSSGPKEVFRAASIIGTEFELTALAAVLDPEVRGTALKAGLDQLQSASLLAATGVSGDAYRFRHTLAQEIAYHSLSFAHRRRLHRRVAAYLEAAHGDALDAPAGVIFHHYDRANDAAKTVSFGVLAGDRARRVFASQEALSYYRRGLAVLAELGRGLRTERSYILERVGDCLDVTGHYSEAAESFTSALREWRRSEKAPQSELFELAPAVRASAREAVLCHRAAAAYERGSDYDAALKWLDAARDALLPRQPLLAADISLTRCISLYRKGRFEEALASGLDGLALARRSRSPAELAHAHNTVANPLQRLGRLKGMASHLKRAVALYEQTGDLPGQARANINLGNCSMWLGNLGAALAHYERGLTNYLRLGNPLRGAIAGNNIGEVLLIQSHLEEAKTRFQSVLDTYEAAHETKAALYGYAFVNLSRVHLKQGDTNAAQSALNRGLAVLRAARARSLVAEACLHKAELELAIGRMETAHRTCLKALTDVRQLGEKLLEARALRVLGRISAARGSLEEAEAHLTEASALAGRLGAAKEWGPALLELAEVQGRLPGKRTQALTSARRAATIFRRLGADLDAEQAAHFRYRAP